MELILQVRGLSHCYGGAKSAPTISDISLDVLESETLGIVGLSGSGKSTLARAIVQCPRPTTGSVHFRGKDLTTLAGRQLRTARFGIQFVFQDPFSSLNERWDVASIVEEPLRIAGVRNRLALRDHVDKILDLVELPASTYRFRRPRELSSGQNQRVAIARALSSEPALLICDEALSSLDAITQSQILALLKSIQRTRKFACVFISHDIGVIRRISNRVATMYEGRICEMSETEVMFSSPKHPHTTELLQANRVLDFSRTSTRPMS